MIGKRRFLTGLMIVLCFVAQVKAETIPFDYWYGRIIGRTQIQSIHDAFNDERGALTTSLKTGYGDAVSVNFGSLFEIGPTSQSNVFQVKFLRPKLSAVVGLGPRLRLNIDKLDWQEDSQFGTSVSGFNFTQQSQFASDQTLRMLHKDVEYDADRSLYHYESGILMQPGNWSLNVRLQTVIGDNSRKSQGMIYSYLGGPAFLKVVEDNDTRTWLARAVSSYGVSRELQLTWGLEHRHGDNPANRNVDLYEPDDLDSLIASSIERRETDIRNSEIFIEPVYLQSNHHWASIKLAYRDDSRTTEIETINGIKSENPVTALRSNCDENHIYTISTRHTWLSKYTPIALQQILDDHSSYYGHRFAPGTLRVNSSLSLEFERYKAWSVREQTDSPLVDSRESKMRRERLTAWSEVTYYSMPNLDLKLRFTLQREAYGGAGFSENADYYHKQAHGLNLQLAYYSYRWDPNERQSIGWDKVSDIDYLLGPLMRPGDWNASISVMPPTHRWTARYSENNIFNFFKGESDNRWSVTQASALGVCEGVELGLDVYYQQEVDSREDGPDYRTANRFEVWSVEPQFQWQPGTHFRVNLKASETYIDEDRVSWYGDLESREHRYRHTWAIKVFYTILI